MGAERVAVNFLQPYYSVQAQDDKPLHFKVRGNGDIEIMPYLEVAGQALTCFPKSTGK